MPLFRAQVILPYFTNLPTDVVVNQFHFLDDTTADFEVIAEDIRSQLSDFYEAIYLGATHKVPYINWAAAVVKVFRLSDAPPRVPIILNLGLIGTATATTNIPTEVALVVSFHAAPQSGVRYQRLYNRIFLGGIPNAWLADATAAHFPRFSAATVSRIAAAAVLLTPNPLAATRWVQVSQAGGVTAVRPISGGWIDNGPDTQRRRSVLADARTPWVADE